MTHLALVIPQIALAIQSFVLSYQFNAGLFFPTLVENAIGILIEVALSLYIMWYNMVVSVIVVLPSLA